MATHRSAEKRHRQNLKKNERNRQARSRTRTIVKSTVALAAEGKKDEALQTLRLATRQIDKDAIHGLVHKNNAQRKISRLTKAVNKLLEVQAA